MKYLLGLLSGLVLAVAVVILWPAGWRLTLAQDATAQEIKVKEQYTYVPAYGYDIRTPAPAEEVEPPSSYPPGVPPMPKGLKKRPGYTIVYRNPQGWTYWQGDTNLIPRLPGRIIYIPPQ